MIYDSLGFARYADTRADQLSGGTLAKLNLGLALLPDPDVLLLDEPYAGFDWDTYQKFWSDMQMFTTTMTQPDPQTFMEQFTTWELSQKANKWASRNISRWRNEEYDKAHTAAQSELDPVKRAALFIKMNDLVCSDNYVIPVVYRPRVSAAVLKLAAPLSGWDNDLWALPHWYKDKDPG
jgi:ATPase subunit of ABC transporter with duplicated ATPase domains